MTHSPKVGAIVASILCCTPASADWLISTYQSSSGQIETLSQADALVANPANRVGSGLYATFNSVDNVGDGFYPNGVKPPGLVLPDNNDFAVTGTGYLKVTSAGDYKFAQLTDDGARLRLDGNPLIVDNTLHPAFYPDNVKYSDILHLSEGLHPIEFLYFERNAGAGGEVFLVHPQTNTPIALVGDVANGGMEVTQVVPEPGVCVLAALAAIALVRRRRHRFNQTIHPQDRTPESGC